MMNKYIEDIEDVYCYVGDYLDDGKELIYVTYNIIIYLTINC